MTNKLQAPAEGESLNIHTTKRAEDLHITHNRTQMEQRIMGGFWGEKTKSTKTNENIRLLL